MRTIMPDNVIEQMIDDCRSVLDIDKAHGGPGFSDWEKEFLDSIEDQYTDRGTLSEKQIAVLKKMWERI